MQVLVEAVDSYFKRDFRGTQFMLGSEDSEIIHKAAEGDAEAKLVLVKNHLDLIVQIAAEYSAKTGKSFFQMIKAGTLAVIRTAEKSYGSYHIGFADRVRDEIVKAIKEII